MSSWQDWLIQIDRKQLKSLILTNLKKEALSQTGHLISKIIEILVKTPMFRIINLKKLYTVSKICLPDKTE